MDVAAASRDFLERSGLAKARAASMKRRIATRERRIEHQHQGRDQTPDCNRGGDLDGKARVARERSPDRRMDRAGPPRSRAASERGQRRHRRFDRCGANVLPAGWSKSAPPSNRCAARQKAPTVTQ